MNPIHPSPYRKSPRFASNASPSSSSSTITLVELNDHTDVLIEIFKRTPLKSLVRLTCVCKAWYSLLTSPPFMSAHQSYIKNDTKNEKHLFREALNVQSQSPITKFSVYKFLLSTYFTPADPKDYVCPVGNKHFVVCTCDGLVCMFDFYSRNPQNAPLILWNPSIRKACLVPPPVGWVFQLTRNGFPKLIFGAGFDPVSNDYVVVRIAYFNDGDSEGTLFRGDVYGLSVEEWKRLEEASVLCCFSTIRWRGVCFNGVIHWVGKLNVSVNGDDGSVCRSILTFKLGRRAFGVMDLPKEIAGVINQTVRVVTVPNVGGKDLLGVIQNVGNDFNLWVMKEYGFVDSWVKLLSVDLHRMLSNDLNVAILGSELVAVHNQIRNGWVFYFKGGKKMSLMNSVPSDVDYVDRYVESLLLYSHRSGILQPRQACLNRGASSRRGRRRRT